MNVEHETTLLVEEIRRLGTEGKSSTALYELCSVHVCTSLKTLLWVHELKMT